MKNFYNKLLILFVAFSLFSCSSDDDSSTPASIVGSWRLVNYSENGVQDFDPAICDDLNNYYFYDNGSMKDLGFTPDTSTNDCVEDDIQNGTYEVSGDRVFMDYGSDFQYTYTYTVNSTTLVLTSRDSSSNATIVETYQRIN